MKNILLLVLLSPMAVMLVAQSEKNSITGIVSSEGEPLIGASVYVKGTTAGTVTDFDGSFSIPKPEDPDAILMISYTGYVTQEIPITDKSYFEILLLESAIELDEAVVTALGIKREKKALGYAVQDVKGDALATNPSTNVINGLSGKVAGVQITQSNSLGGGSQVTIRGNGSILGNNQPLYVIDGVPMEGNFASPGTDGSDASALDNNVYGGGISEINPDNIESISVLKGANAAALYGSRAANGVILITTKNGAGRQGLGVDYSINYTFDNPLVVPEFQDIYGGGNGYVTWYTDGRNGGITDPTELAQFQAAYGDINAQGTAGVDESWGAPMDGRLVRHWWSGTEVAPLVPAPESWENFWETGQSLNHSLSLSGSNEQGSFRLSMGHLDQTGLMYNNDYSRTNFRLNSDYNFTEKFSVSVRGEYIKSGSDNRQQPVLWEPQTWHHRHDDWGLLKQWEDYMDVHITREGDEYPYANWQHSFALNRFYEQEFLTRSNEKDRFLGSIAVNYKITDNLSVLLRSGTDIWSDTRISVTRNERIKSGVERTQSYREDVLRRQETNNDLLLTYNKYFNDKFSLDAKVGAAQRINYYKRNFIGVNDLTINGLYNVANNATTNNNSSFIEESEVQSVYGALSLGYGNFVYLDVTARNDWSSTLPSDNWSYFYPSASASVILSEALDFSSTPISFAKLRFGWAQVGNDTRAYGLRQVFTPATPWNASTPVFSESKGLANSELKPELTTSIEGGFDIRFLNGRIGLDVTLYDQTTTDQIMNIAVASSTGYQTKTINAGKISNKGIEAVLSATVIQTKDFSWDVGINYARNQNMIEELFTDENGNELQTIVLHSRRGLSLEARVGQPYGTLYGSAYRRVQEGEFAGQIVFEDGVAQKEDDLQIIGNVTPDWIGGFQNTIRFKNFTLSALIDAKIGGDITDESTSTGMQTGVYPITALGREEGVIGVGVKNIGSSENPEYVRNDVVGDTKSVVRQLSVRSVNEGAVFEASYIKLREMRLTYVVPTKLLERSKFIRGLQLSFVGRNLAILYNTHHQIDPEFNLYGGNLQGALFYATVPSARTLGANLNISF